MTSRRWGPEDSPTGGSGAHAAGSWNHPVDPSGRKRRKPLVITSVIGVFILLAIVAGVYLVAGPGGCSGRDAITLRVAVAPDLAPAVAATAKDFNAGAHSVAGTCVRAVVSDADPYAVATLLSGQGISNGLTQKPDVWIPDSTLWTRVVRASGKGRQNVRLTQTSVAQSPLVVAMPAALAARLRGSGVLASPSWTSLFAAEGGVTGGAVTKHQAIPPGLIKLNVPDPTRNASGMAVLTLTNALLAGDPNKQSIFTGIVRTMHNATIPAVNAGFTDFAPNAAGRFPVVLGPEQAVWQHNQDKPKNQAVAIYPTEGTTALDYPYTITTTDTVKTQAASLLEKALTSADAQKRVRGLGFRAADGTAPDASGARSGISPQRPHLLRSPSASDVTRVMQAWTKLTLGSRLLLIFDVSGSMATVVPGTTLTRIRTTAQIAQGGVALLGDDSEVGLWAFSTGADGNRPWQELVPIGRLGDRYGSANHRQLIQTGLGRLKVNPKGDTALYATILAAFRQIRATYKPDMINSVVLLTDGKNDDPGGITLKQTLAELKKENDPKRPIRLIMFGYGKGVDRDALQQIADTTSGGGVYVAYTPAEMQKVVLEAISKRTCAPTCTRTN
jgi:Bacterial extracellular solute-binding protein/von Willebrand factor type A domain